MTWIGQTIKARYRIDRELGAGGMGNVYLAHDVEVRGRQVVVKVPHEHLLDAEFRTRFIRETDQLIQLAHPHVIHVYDAGEHENVPFLVVQYVGGGDLQDKMRETPQFGPAAVLDWLAPIGDALDFIHRRGHVHRDVKPGNVLFDDDGNAFLSDFGIATVMTAAQADATRADLTQAGLFIGSPLYAPPEAVVRDLRPQYDQYSLALIAYQCLTGSLPFEADSGPQMMTAKLTREPLPIQEIAPHLAPGAGAVIMRALARDPSHRYGTCREFAEAFRAGSSGAATDAPAPGFHGEETLLGSPVGQGSGGFSQPQPAAPAPPPPAASSRGPAWPSAAEPGHPAPPGGGHPDAPEESPAAARRRRREERRRGRSSAEAAGGAGAYGPSRGARRWPWVAAVGVVLAVAAGILGWQLLPDPPDASSRADTPPVWELEGEDAAAPRLPPEMSDFFPDEGLAGESPVAPPPELPPETEEVAGEGDPSDDELPALADPEPPAVDPEVDPVPPVEPPPTEPEPPRIARRPPPEPPAPAPREPEPEPMPEPGPPLDLPAFDVSSRSEEAVARVRTNVRASPDTRSEKVDFLTPGDRVKVTGAALGGTWLRIDATGGQVGYVKAASLGTAPPKKPDPPAGGKRAVVVAGKGGSILRTASIQPATRTSMGVPRSQADRGIRVGGQEHWFRFETFTFTIGQGTRKVVPTGGFVQTVAVPAGTPASAKVELLDTGGRVLDSREMPAAPSNPARLWLLQPRPGRLEHRLHEGRIVLEAQVGLRDGGVDVDAAGVSWVSDRDGHLGSGGVIMVNLSEGPHTLTASAPGVAPQSISVDVVHTP